MRFQRRIRRDGEQLWTTSEQPVSRRPEKCAVEILSHVFTALGRLLLSISSLLVVEELTLGGLARLLLSTRDDSRSRSAGKTREAAVSASRKDVGSR
jgi:hypothetical protein